jgi:hypothetical protein
MTFSTLRMDPAIFSSNITTTFNSSIFITLGGVDYLIPVILA